jgi:predicted nucleic acid-binding protein
MNYETLHGKFLLLDTNLLIYYSKYEPYFENLFKKIETRASFVVVELVKFEFFRGATSNRETVILQNLLNTFSSQPNSQDFPITSEVLANSREIANIYSWKLKNNKISLADCMIAGEMKKYNEHTERLYLATTDHDYFPRLLFKRIGIETIDTGDKIFNIGFYSFDAEAYKKLKAEFQNQ